MSFLERGAGGSSPRDYSFFDPRAYVREYYSSIGTENSFLLHFHEAVSQTLPPNGRMLEFGGGPTIYQLLSACTQVREIVFSDFLAANRNEVSLWLREDPGALEWNEYLDFVLRMKELEQTAQSRAWLQRELSRKVSAVVECDAFRKNVLGGYSTEPFDVVASSFCLECITGEESEFLGAVKHVESLLRPGGTLVLALLKRAYGYKVGELLFPAFPLSEGYASAMLEELGYEVLYLGSIPAEAEQGYDGIMTIAATKK